MSSRVFGEAESDPTRSRTRGGRLLLPKTAANYRGRTTLLHWGLGRHHVNRKSNTSTGGHSSHRNHVHPTERQGSAASALGLQVAVMGLRAQHRSHAFPR